MGYFANGTEGDMYEAWYCSRCIHGDDCAVWLAHQLFNYGAEGEKSLLNLLIPREGVFNGKCKMFIEKEQEK